MYSKNYYQFQDFTIDKAKRRLSRFTQTVSISDKAFDILLFLLENKGKIVTKDEMMDQIWADSFVEEANLPVHISAIRRILGEKKGENKFIKTVSGRGYSFVAEVKNLEKPNISNQVISNNSFLDIADNSISIAVIPFSLENEVEKNEYFINGITQSLINDLSQVSQLRILSFNAVKEYKNSKLTLQEIGFLLDADKILTGYISKYENKLVIAVELVNSADNICIWGKEVVFEADDIFNIKKQISTAIVETLKLKLNLNNTAKKELDVKAQKLYYRGKHILESKVTHSNVKKVLNQALDFFKKAIELEPAYAMAYVGIGDVYVSYYLYYFLESDKAYSKAKMAFNSALEINDKISDVFVLKGSMEMLFERKFQEAEKSYDYALALNPNDPNAYHWKVFLSTCLTKHSKAIEFGTKAIKLDPTSIRFNDQLVRVFYYAGDMEKAIIQAEEIREFNENSIAAHYFLALSYAQLESFDLALEHIDVAINLRNDAEIVLCKAKILALSNNNQEAEKLIQSTLKKTPVEQIEPVILALAYAALENVDKTFEYLEMAYEKNSPDLCMLRAFSDLDPIKEDKRFQNLLTKLNLNDNQI